MKRAAKPELFEVRAQALATYEAWMREREDLITASVRGYVSDLCQFFYPHRTA